MRVLLLTGLLLLRFPLAAAGHGDGEVMTGAAIAFLAQLRPEQQARACLPFESAERENWHFVPRARQGLPLRDLTPVQQESALAFVRSGLSVRGGESVAAVLALEEILFDAEGESRHPGLYYVTIFGTPRADGTWGWRFEGHHLSLNFTVVKGHASAWSPAFFGANPAEVKAGPRRGWRPMAADEDLARELALSFDETQEAKGVLSARAPRDIITGADRTAQPLKPLGLSFAAMSATQKEKLKALVQNYVGRMREETARADLERIAEDGWEQVHFAWAGSRKKGEGHYYRVQGPGFLLEYDNTQGGANHIHAVWRDFAGDFGRDVLKDHYTNDHGTK